MDSINYNGINNNTAEDIPHFAPVFSLEGLKTRAYVSDICDTETISIIFKFNGVYNKWHCKLPCTLSENFLKQTIYKKNITVHCGKFDLYGKLLIDIYYDKRLTSQEINFGDMVY